MKVKSFPILALAHPAHRNQPAACIFHLLKGLSMPLAGFLTSFCV
jgi:hypothetical protein